MCSSSSRAKVAEWKRSREDERKGKDKGGENYDVGKGKEDGGGEGQRKVRWRSKIKHERWM